MIELRTKITMVCPCCGECRQREEPMICTTCKIDMLVCTTQRMALFVSRLPRDLRIAYAAGLWRMRDQHEPKWKRFVRGNRRCGNSSSKTFSSGSTTSVPAR